MLKVVNGGGGGESRGGGKEGIGEKGREAIGRGAGKPSGEKERSLRRSRMNGNISL